MKPYPSYKPSGVPWLGEMPAHWAIKSLRRVTDGLAMNGIFKKNDEFGDGAPLVNVTDLFSDNFFVDGSSLERVRCSEQELNQYQVCDGDLFLVRSSLKLEGIAMFAVARNIIEPTVFECHVVRLRPDSSLCNSRFMAFFLNSSYGRQSLISRSKSTTMTTIDQAEVLSTYIVSPPLNEQQAIATYLDRETARIDRLLAEKGRLIDTLREYRQATISEVVTQGLDPAAPKKPSGVPWLRELPAHWDTYRLRFLITTIESGKSVNAADTPAMDYQLGVLKTSCVYTRSFRPQENKTVVPQEEHLVSCPLRLDALIVSRMNTPELVGAAGLVREAPANVFLPDRLWQVVLDRALAVPSYVYWFTNALGYSDQVKNACSGSSESMQNLAQDKFRDITLPVPPLSEQQAIAAYLDRETARIDKLLAHVQDEIKLLQELRAATITDAVTGKIQVA